MFKNFLSAPFKKNTGLKNGAGLTLIELLVVISIMMTMTAVVFVNYRPGNQQLALNRSASKLAQDIRRAQEMAMSSAECPLGTGCAGQVPPRYGVYGRESSVEKFYRIFADCVKGGCVIDDGIWHTANDEEIEIQYYEERIELSVIQGVNCICSCAPCPACIPGGQRRAHISFKPPDPITEIVLTGPPASPHLARCSEVVMTLRVGATGPTRTVRVNNAGLIYVE